MPTTFVVRITQADGTTVQTRLIDAERATQVRDHLLTDGTIIIDKATTQECVDLGKAGVAIEQAGVVPPAPEQQAKAAAPGGEGGAG